MRLATRGGDVVGSSSPLDAWQWLAARMSLPSQPSVRRKVHRRRAVAGAASLLRGLGHPRFAPLLSVARGSSAGQGRRDRLDGARAALGALCPGALAGAHPAVQCTGAVSVMPLSAIPDRTRRPDAASGQLVDEEHGGQLGCS